MKTNYVKYIIFLILAVLTILSSISVNPVSSTVYPNEPWTTQATGCQPVANNINGVINDVYLGVGTTVPQSILNLYPSALATYLEDWKTNMVGMSINQFKAFIIPAADGYPSGNLAGKNLYFETTILQILNIDCNNVATRNSVVNVRYSLYTDCSVSGGTEIATSTGSSITISSCSTSGANLANNTNELIPILMGIVFISIIAGGIGYVINKGRKPNLNTEKILEKTREKETVGIKNLKDSLATNTQSSNINTTTSKRPTSTRRRK